ncbi:MAG: hypothetical protein ACKKMW_00700 [Candidatus Nealsonbacteria bacterium]
MNKDKRLIRKKGMGRFANRKINKLIDANTTARIQIKLLSKGSEQLGKLVDNMKKVATHKRLFKIEKAERKVARDALKESLDGDEDGDGDEDENEDGETLGETIPGVREFLEDIMNRAGHGLSHTQIRDLIREKLGIEIEED